MKGKRHTAMMMAAAPPWVSLVFCGERARGQQPLRELFKFTHAWQQGGRTAAGACKYCRLVSSSSRPPWSAGTREKWWQVENQLPQARSGARKARPGTGAGTLPRVQEAHVMAPAAQLLAGRAPLGVQAACLACGARPRCGYSAQRAALSLYAQVGPQPTGDKRTIAAPVCAQGRACERGGRGELGAHAGPAPTDLGEPRRRRRTAGPPGRPGSWPPWGRKAAGGPGVGACEA
jgi:hypothetical protein